MKNAGKLVRLAGLAAFCIAILLPAEMKAQVKKMSAKDLTDESNAVLYGKCKSVKSEWNEKHSLIFTYVTIIPEGYVKGNLGSEVVVMIPGGRVGDILYDVSETPYFTQEEEVVAFICTDRSGKNLITGGPQGKVKIEKDQLTGKRSVFDQDPDIAGQEENSGLKSTGQQRKIALEDFVAKLKGYSKN